MKRVAECLVRLTILSIAAATAVVAEADSGDQAERGLAQ
jgi:hypothetical protein